MEKHIYYIIVAVIIAALVPLVPQMLRFRIWILEKLHLIWLANLTKNYFKQWVIISRIILAIIAVVLLFLGLSGS